MKIYINCVEGTMKKKSSEKNVDAQSSSRKRKMNDNANSKKKKTS